MEFWSAHHLYETAKEKLGAEDAIELRKYAQRLMNLRLPVIFSLGHLANIAESDYQFLRDTVNRRREAANYKMFAVRKRSGGRRFIHAVSGQLISVQQFINTEILQKISPHPCSFAFHRSGGIRECAASHCGAKWLFQYDLSDFFYNVNEKDVFQIFERLGYRSILSLELARICTTTRLPRHLDRYLRRRNSRTDDGLPYKIPDFIGVLPQGAPTSPMLSNFAAENLDIQLNDFAVKNGFVYTRYADDLTLSATSLPQKMSFGDIHRSIVGSIRYSGFRENEKKIRIAGPGSKKIVLGLLVDGERPRISKETYNRIDRHLYASEKFGIVQAAKYEGFDSAYGFYNHIAGLVAFVSDVDKKRGEEFRKRIKNIPIRWDTV